MSQGLSNFKFVVEQPGLPNKEKSRRIFMKNFFLAKDPYISTKAKFLKNDFRFFYTDPEEKIFSYT